MSETSVLLYDGDCGFCTRSVRVAERLSVRAHVVPWQEAELADLGVTEQWARSEVLFVERPGGRVHGGAGAVAALLRSCAGPWRFAGVLLAAPGVRTCAGVIYRAVARNRHRLPGETPACLLPPERRPGGRSR